MSAGKRLGRYELIEQLGQGGMGEVWLARLTGAAGFEKPCLLKSVLPKLAGDAQFVQRFQHEGRVLVHLQHANIAQVLDMGDADGALYIALEYVMGVDVAVLHDAVFRNGKQIPVPLALWICQQAAEGLAYAHGKTAPDGTRLEIVHRDVSPHNLMVSYDGEVKVIDFGIARSSARAAQTQPQTVLGKIGYMAPEQARGEEVDARADQYALGIVLWELLTDQPFVRPGSVGEMMGSMANPTSRPVREYRADLPVEVDAVLQRALAPDPAQRYPRMADFASALTAELARRYNIPNREELSTYVRATCSEQWAAHQELLKRVTSGQQAAAPAPAPEKPRPGPAAQDSGVSPALQRVPRAEGEPPSREAETRVSKPVRGPRRDAGAPAAEPAAAPAPSTRVVERPRAPLSTDEAISAVRPSRAPALIIAGTSLVLAAGLYWLLAHQPQAVDTPHGPVPTPEPAPAVAAKPGPPADAGAAEPPKPKPLAVALRGRVIFRQEPVPHYAFTNTDSFRWTDCQAFFPGKLRGLFPDLIGGASFELRASALVIQSAAPDLNGKVNVRCRQGSGTFPIEGL